MMVSDHAFCLALGVLIFTVITYILLRYKINSLIGERHSNFMSAASQNISTLYSILLAFIVVVSWQNYNSTQNTLTEEAVKIQVLWRDSLAFQPEIHQKISQDLNGYLIDIINKEWPLMQQKTDNIDDTSYSKLWRIYYHIEPKTKNEAIFLQASVDALNSVSQARRTRILAADSSLPNGLWFLLIMGATCTIITTMLFENIELKLRLLVCGMEIMLLSIAFYLISCFEHPYQGLAALDASVFQHALTTINHSRA